MSGIEMEIFRKPFRRWMGPYSPARGFQHGLRFHQGALGVWHANAIGKEFSRVQRSGAVDRLTRAVIQTWGGGRLLFLPNGYIVKPLPGGDDERGKRVIVGTFSGSLVLVDGDGVEFDFAEPTNLRAGSQWEGPTTLGLECVMEPDGAVRCDWRHPDDYGRMRESKNLTGPSVARARSFRSARPGESSGRVHLTPNGHVTTNVKVRGNWEARYVCHIDLVELADWSHWIM